MPQVLYKQNVLTLHYFLERHIQSSLNVKLEDSKLYYFLFIRLLVLSTCLYLFQRDRCQVLRDRCQVGKCRNRDCISKDKVLYENVTEQLKSDRFCMDIGQISILCGNHRLGLISSQCDAPKCVYGRVIFQSQKETKDQDLLIFVTTSAG